MVISGVYGIINIVNDKLYIGSSVDIYKRWCTHKSRLRRGVHENIHLQAAYAKYGKDAFVYSIVEVVNKNILVEREQYYLDIFLPEYNMACEAKNNHDILRSPEYRQRMSEKVKNLWNCPEYRANVRKSQKGWAPSAIANARVANLGKKRPVEVVKKITEANTGKKRSAGAIKKMSDAQRIRHIEHPLTPEAIEKRRVKMTGRKMSSEAIAKSSAGRRGQKRSLEICAKISVAKTRLPRYAVDGLVMSISQDKGLYWYGRYRENGKWRKRYFGRTDPRPLYPLVDALVGS